MVAIEARIDADLPPVRCRVEPEWAAAQGVLVPEAYSERVLAMRTTRQRGRGMRSGLWIGSLTDRMGPVGSIVVRLWLNFSPFRVDFYADSKSQVGPKGKVSKSSKLLAVFTARYPQFSFQK